MVAENQGPSQAANRAPLPRRGLRRWLLFLTVALGLAMLPLLLLELLVRMMGAGVPDERHDPYVGFESIRPLFEHAPQTDEWVARMKELQPKQLSRHPSIDK